MISGHIDIELREGSDWDIEPNQRYLRRINIPGIYADVDGMAEGIAKQVEDTIKKASQGFS